jgi:hypothetical protein
VSFLAASVFFLYIGHLLNISLGLFHPKIAFYTVFYFALVPLMVKRVLWPRWRYTPQSSSSLRHALYLLLSGGQLVFIHSLVKNPHVIYSSNLSDPLAVGLTLKAFFSSIFSVAQSTSVLLFFVLILTLLVKKEFKKTLEFVYRSLAVTLIVLLVFAQILVPLLSPHPWIDVFVNNTAAVDFFLKGKNPYIQTYVDVYNGLFSYPAGFLYFPGLLFCLAPFRVLFGDIRYAFIFAQILNAILIYRIVKRREDVERSLDKTVGTLLPWLLPVLWLSFPVIYHVLEQSWTDTLLITFTFLIVDSIDLKRWGWVGLLAGLVFTTKQYGFIISLFAVLRVAQIGGVYSGLRSAGLAAGAFSAVLIPFMLANFKGLYAMTIQAQVSPGIRTDSLGMSALFALKWGYYFPSSMQILISVLGLVGGIGMILSDPLKKMDRVAVALFFAYGCSFLFGKWAFCNYHYLLASFLILYLATMLEGSKSPGLI